MTSSNHKLNFQEENHSESPIHQIYNLNINKKEIIETNFSLQIIGIKKLDVILPNQDSKDQDIFCLTLSDKEFFYNGFIVLLQKNSSLLKKYDIINVNSFTIYPNKSNQKVLKVNQYEFLKRLNYILGNPKNINKNLNSDEFQKNNQQYNKNEYTSMNEKIQEFQNSSCTSESNNFPNANYLNNNNHQKNFINNKANKLIFQQNFHENGLYNRFEMDFNNIEQENINKYDSNSLINVLINPNNPIPSRNQRINSKNEDLISRNQMNLNKNFENSRSLENNEADYQNLTLKKREREKDELYNYSIRDNNTLKQQEQLKRSNRESTNVKKIYIPLSQLTTFSKDFTILIRITKKSTIKNFNSTSSGSSGRLFNFNIMDFGKSEMQVTCFNRGVDKYYNIIEENKVYEITGGYIKLNDRKFFSGANKSEYKLVIDDNCHIIEMPDDGSIEKSSVYNFLKISNIFLVNLYAIVDICVFVIECGDVQLKNTKNGEQLLRKLIVSDESECKVELTLWRSHAESKVEKNQFLIVKNVKVGEFNGRNFSSYEDTQILINPNMKEVNELKMFIENYHCEFKNVSTIEGKNQTQQTNDNVGQIYFMQDILDMIEVCPENFDNNSSLKKIKATITQMIHNDRNFYGGCPDMACKRKSIFNEQKGEWMCNYCSKSFLKPSYYYNLSLRVKDSSCEHWIDLFGGNAEKILKISAEEYRNILLNGDHDRIKEINDNVEFKTFYFCVRLKIQSFNGKFKKKIYAYKFEPVPCLFETNRIIDILQRFSILHDMNNHKSNSMTNYRNLNTNNFPQNNYNTNNFNNMMNMNNFNNIPTSNNFSRYDQNYNLNLKDENELYHMIKDENF